MSAVPDPRLFGPATNAARRAGGLSRQSPRAYPDPFDPDDLTGDSVVLAATRAMLRGQTRTELASIVRTAIHDLGGAIVPARLAGSEALPVDVSVGVGEPLLVVAERLSIPSMKLVRHLPLLVQDALAAAARCEQARRQEQRACVDVLTGVASRSEIGLRLGLTRCGDIVCMFDLDGFKQLNDARGHAAGDEELRSFGALLRAAVREGDFCGRYGGDEFMVVLVAATVEGARHRMSGLAAQWVQREGSATSVSVGLAPIDERGAASAVAAADKALYRAKRLGRNRVEVASPEDYDYDYDGRGEKPLA